MRRNLLVIIVAAVVVLAAISAARAQAAGSGDKLNVVASFSILRDWVAEVGGDRVEVSALVGPGGDAHVYAPTPRDAKIVGAAKLIVVNGLGFEGWMDRLVQASAARAPVIVASAGVVPRSPPYPPPLGARASRPLLGGGTPDSSGVAKKAGETPALPGGVANAAQDPHAWQSVRNAEIYVSNIRDGLIQADPQGRLSYHTNAAAYIEELARLDARIRQAVAMISPARRKVITTHDAFAYFAADYGIAFIATQGVSTETDASARDIARIIRLIREENIPALFFENAVDPRLVRRIAAETGARIGGTLFSDTLTTEAGPAATYVGMMRHNIREIVDALK